MTPRELNSSIDSKTLGLRRREVQRFNDSSANEKLMVAIKLIAVNLEVSSNMLCYDPSLLVCSGIHDSATRILGNRIKQGRASPRIFATRHYFVIVCYLSPFALGLKQSTGCVGFSCRSDSSRNLCSSVHANRIIHPFGTCLTCSSYGQGWREIRAPMPTPLTESTECSSGLTVCQFSGQRLASSWEPQCSGGVALGDGPLATAGGTL